MLRYSQRVRCPMNPSCLLQIQFVHVQLLDPVQLFRAVSFFRYGINEVATLVVGII